MEQLQEPDAVGPDLKSCDADASDPDGGWELHGRLLQIDSLQGEDVDTPSKDAPAPLPKHTGEAQSNDASNDNELELNPKKPDIVVTRIKTKSIDTLKEDGDGAVVPQLSAASSCSREMVLSKSQSLFKASTLTSLHNVPHGCPAPVFHGMPTLFGWTPMMQAPNPFGFLFGQLVGMMAQHEETHMLLGQTPEGFGVGLPPPPFFPWSGHPSFMESEPPACVQDFHKSYARWAQRQARGLKDEQPFNPCALAT